MQSSVLQKMVELMISTVCGASDQIVSFTHQPTYMIQLLTMLRGP